MLLLTDKELLVLAVMLGANNLYGMKDPFRGMNQREIWAEIPTVQLELEKKGYISLGFDNDIKIVPEVQDLLSICIHCDKYLIFDSIVDGKLQDKNVLFFLHNVKCVLMKQNASNWELQDSELSEFITELQNKILINCEDFSGTDEKVLITQSDLERAAQQSDDRQALEMLHNLGCSPAMTKVLLAGFRRNCTYYSLRMFDLTMRSVQTLNCLLSEHGGLQITPVEVNSFTNSQITWINRKQTKELLAKNIQCFLGGVA